MKRKLGYMTLMASVVLFNACSGGSTDTADAVVGTAAAPAVEGVLVDSPVEGAEYRCGRIVKMTHADGRFVCDTLPVSFYVGGIKLGEIIQLPNDKMVTPQDLLELPRNDFGTAVRTMALFLQSLDDDGDIVTRISLDRGLVQRLAAQNDDIQMMTEAQVVTLLQEIGAARIVTAEEAETHLREQLDNPPTTVVTDINNTAVDPVPDTTAVLDDAVKQAYLDVINEARSIGRNCGDYGYFPAAAPLLWSDALYDAALEHSRDMAISNTFSHTGSGTQSDETAEVLHPGTGSSVDERIEQNGYTDWNRYGENIAAGTVMDEAVEAMEGWLASPGHCKNIMKAEFAEVGMAVYYDENSHYSYYWTQDFGTR